MRRRLTVFGRGRGSGCGSGAGTPATRRSSEEPQFEASDWGSTVLPTEQPQAVSQLEEPPVEKVTQYHLLDPRGGYRKRKDGYTSLIPSKSIEADDGFATEGLSWNAYLEEHYTEEQADVIDICAEYMGKKATLADLVKYKGSTDPVMALATKTLECKEITDEEDAVLKNYWKVYLEENYTREQRKVIDVICKYWGISATFRQLEGFSEYDTPIREIAERMVNDPIFTELCAYTDPEKTILENYANSAPTRAVTVNPQTPPGHTPSRTN